MSKVSLFSIQTVIQNFHSSLYVSGISVNILNTPVARLNARKLIGMPLETIILCPCYHALLTTDFTTPDKFAFTSFSCVFFP